MISYVVYKPCGEIVRTGVCEESVIQHQANEGELYLVGTASDSQQYIHEGAIVDKPEMFVEVRGNIMKVPKNSGIYIDGEFFGTCETGVVELQFEDYSEYRVKVVKFPYKDYETDIGVNNAY